MMSSTGDEFNFDTSKAPVTVEKGTQSHQLYSQATWEWHGVFLGIVMVYDATDPVGRVHCRLSWSSSADVLSDHGWEWVDQGGVAGKDFIPLGSFSSTHNDFDSHICFAAATPTMAPDGRVRLYYMGGNGTVISFT